MGVGFVAVLPAGGVDGATALLESRGIHTWVMGEVSAADGAPVDDGVEVVRGAKGVDGGSVQVVGEHPTA
jgi:phosphoribosylformylglycinamidine cyclo-ligase